MARSATHRAFLLAATLLAVLLCLPVLAPPVTGASDDGTCVGSGEYKAIKVGMTIEKLGKVLHGQTPFATIDGRGKTRYRWYFACEAWQPDRDVVVRYHQPVVGRRTVSRKALDVYVAPGG